jgi:hypothetical protein
MQSRAAVSSIFLCKDIYRRIEMFTKKDYESGDGFQTNVFGPLLWNSLHIISFNYPVHPTKKDKETYKAYFLSLGNVLPCGHCRTNFPHNLNRAGFTDAAFDSRDSFSRFVYKLHNVVNEALGKSFDLTFDEVRNRYEQLRARCHTVPEPHAHETGCVEALHGKRARCVINIVPVDSKLPGFAIHKECVAKGRDSGQFLTTHEQMMVSVGNPKNAPQSQQKSGRSKKAPRSHGKARKSARTRTARSTKKRSKSR